MTNQKNENITEREIEVEFERLLQAYANRLQPDELIKNMDSIKRQAREHAIGRKLLLKEAQRLNMEAADSEVQNEVNAITEKLGGEEAFKSHLAKKGLTAEQMKEIIRGALLVEKLIAHITSGVIEAGDEEVAVCFESRRGELPENIPIEQVKSSIREALTNAAKNRKLLDYIENLKT